MTPLRELDAIVKAIENTLQNDFYAEGDNLLSKAQSVQNRLSAECLDKIQTVYRIYREALCRENYFAQENLPEVRQLAASIREELAMNEAVQPSLAWRVMRAILLLPVVLLGKIVNPIITTEYSSIYKFYFVCGIIGIIIAASYFFYLIHYIHSLFP